MATLLAGGLFATRALFKYNRKNFMFDKHLKQEREFQEQDMRVVQFGLYREDVRDLVELTVGKMDLYLVSAALLIDRTTVMITKADEALPGFLMRDPLKRISPEWAVALNAMSLASGVFYLLLCLWLAMYASISAQSFGTRLLTQFVRLPTASQYNVAKATATALQYEDKDLSEMLRVPIIQAGGPSQSQAVSQVAQEPQPPEPDDPQIAGSGVSFLGRLPSSNGLITNPSYNILPAAMLDHIRLYRRVQLNWQAYDAYARVSLFCGANSLLYSCLYWALGSFLTGQHAGVAAVAVALVFATIQVMLAKLDLRLRSWHLRRIACLLGFTPVTTTLGMFLYADMADSHRGPFAWQRLLMNFCAITAHVLHTIVAYMVLMAAWPDANHHDEEALLPGKFRSTLYLDVFGWLLNPTGPGPRRSEREDDDDEVRSMRSFMGSRQENATTPPTASPPSASPPTRPASVEAIRPKRTRWESASAVSFRGSTAESSSRTSRRTSRSSLRVPGSPGTSQSFTEGATQRLLESQAGQSFWQRMRRSINSFGPRDSEVNFSPELEAEVRRTFPSPTSLRRNNTVDGGSQVDRYGGNEAASIEDMHAVNDPAADTAANFMGREAPRNVSQRKSMLPGQRPWNAFKRGTQIIVLLWTASVIWAVVKSVLNIHDAWKSEKEAALRDTPQHLVEVAHFFTPSLCAGLQQELQRRSHVLPWSSWTQANLESPVLDAGCGWETAEDVSLTCDATSCTAGVLQRGGRNVTLCTAIPRGGKLTLTPLGLSWTLTSGASPLRNLALQLQGESLHIYARTHQDGLLLLRPRGEQLRPVLEVETSKERGSWTPESLLVLKDVLFSFRPEDASCEGAGLLTAWQLDSGVKFQRVLGTEAALNMTFCSPSVVASF